MADRTLKVQVKLETDQKELNNLQQGIKNTIKNLNTQVAGVKQNIQTTLATGLASNSVGQIGAAISSVTASVDNMKAAWKAASSNINSYMGRLRGALNEYEFDLKLVEKEIANMGNIPLSNNGWDNNVPDTTDMRAISGRWFEGEVPTYRDLVELAEQLKLNIQETKSQLAQTRAEADALKQNMKDTEAYAANANQQLANHRVTVSGTNNELKEQNRQIKANQRETRALGKDFKGLIKPIKMIFRAFGIGYTIRIIRKAISDIKTLMESAVGWLPKAIGNITNSFRTLKGQVNAAIAEMFATLEPILVSIMGYLTKFFEWVSKIIAVLNGKTTYYKAVLTSNSALKDSADQAKQIKKQLMGFDEINQITSDTDTSSDTSSNDLGYKLVETEMDTTEIDSLKEQLEKIKDLAIAIGIALLAWRIIDFLSDLGNAITGISTLLTNIGKFSGIILLIAGIAALVWGFLDAWENGVDWKNLTAMVAGVAAIALGLLIIFGPIGAAIGLIIGGIALLVVGIKDWIEKGELTKQTTWLLVAAILALGIALAILVGWPALVVAAVVALVIIIIGYWDEIKEFTIKVWEAIKEFFVNLWESIKTLCVTVWESIKEFFVNLWDSIKQGFIEKWEAFKEAIATAWEAVKNVFVSAWEAIKNYFSEVFANIKDFFVEPWINAIEAIKEVFGKIKDTFGEKFDDIKKHVVDKFTAIKDKVVGIFDTIKQKWENIKSKFSNVVQDVKNFISDIKSAIKIPKLEITYTATTSKALNMIGVTQIPHLSLSWVSAFANGGFPDMGQLFLARESGPELVGKMGNQNAVMNNEQIVNAVSQGVAAAVANVMGSGNNNRDIVLEINGREFCRATYNDFNRVQREHGTSLITV